MINLKNRFKNIAIDCSWSFTDKTIKDTSYITHAYYTYPAKFIPQLASRLINEHSSKGDIVIDPFMGSGTTVVEAIINNRIGVGTDINEIAYLLTKVKTTTINIDDINKEFRNIQLSLESRFNNSYDTSFEEANKIIPKNDRIDYWFLPKQKEKLSIIFARIAEIKDEDIRNFFLIAFAQILKSCSIWLQKSVKPTRDQNKKLVEPMTAFINQSKKMLKKHSDFEQLLPYEVKHNIDKYRIVECNDSRKLPCNDNKASLIITSPPYVTSYEYADLHQLPSLWFSYLKELSEFRQKFIGSAYKSSKKCDVKSSLAELIVKQLGENKKGREVQSYFADMLESFIEMKRTLKKGGRACIVIGNTQFKGVEIMNAEVFQEQCENIGLKTYDVIRREIPSKMLPSTRDIKTGQFVKANDKNLKLAYPTEYILIMEKI
ncbi:MAG: site-specific DNA-methyltransferase [Desulfamplus sp.]|nr:site-specific DNA-methyltransferase [Desulfamplus sp.]MBF0389015.1 site-specific DNA-methyltransferase [Desulfamplus sp.]